MSFNSLEEARAYHRNWRRTNPEAYKKASTKSNRKRAAVRKAIVDMGLAFKKHLTDAGYKQCHKCMEVKERTEFSANKVCVDGIRNHCKACVAAAVNSWYTRNKARHKKLVRDWHTRMKRDNLELWRASNFISHQRRRERHYRNGESTYIKPSTVASVYEKCGYRCLACGTTERLTLDHIVPVRIGGRTVEDNLQVLCGSCNASKGIKVIDYRQELSNAC